MSDVLIEVAGVLLCEENGWAQAVLVSSEGTETICNLDPHTGLWSAVMFRQNHDDPGIPAEGMVDVAAVVDRMMGRQVPR